MEQQFSLSWNNFHGTLTKGFTGLLVRGEFVDVTIAVDGHLLQAHKVILSICSPYFKKMFQMNPCQHPIVVLRDVTYKAMKDLLQFMYHGEVSVKQEDLSNFIGTAEVLQIKGLTNKEIDDDDAEHENELPKQSSVRQSVVSPDAVSHNSEAVEVSHDLHQYSDGENFKQRKCIEKQREYIDKFHLYRLKRKSDEYIQRNYYSDMTSAEKRSKLVDKSQENSDNQIHSKHFELVRNYEDNSVDKLEQCNSGKNSKSNSEIYEKQTDQSMDNGIEVKNECDDSDIVVTDPAVCTTPKTCDINRDEQKETSTAFDYQLPQDNCAGLNSFFYDLKNLVNGKMSNILRSSTNEDCTRRVTEHRLVTIPQKEDGKKKYPQRSCRICWKIGRRRDTRFMCNTCELPFCKSPCFDVHYNDILKISAFRGDIYGT